MTLPAVFETYLLTKGSSRITIKNYLSDLNHFLGWLELTLRSQNLPFSLDDPEYVIRYFNFLTVNKYRNFLVGNELPAKTINRRLSTLRNLASFAISQGWIKENPTKGILNQLSNTNKEKLMKLTDEGLTVQSSNKPMIMGDSDLLDKFKQSLGKENTSPNTIKNYLSDIRKFLNWLYSGTSPLK